MRVVRISPEDWAKHHHVAHTVVFDEEPEADNSCTDFTLVVEDKEETPIIYTTVSDMAKGHACMEFGGSFPDHRGTPTVGKAFLMLLGWFKENGYTSVSFVTRNDNMAMLKLGWFGGFKIVGCSLSQRGLLLENRLEFTEER